MVFGERNFMNSSVSFIDDGNTLFIDIQAMQIV